MISGQSPILPSALSHAREESVQTTQAFTRSEIANGGHTAVSSSFTSSSNYTAVTYQKPVQAAAPIEALPETNPYASNILNAIQAQLGRDLLEGADPEALQSRLAAGLEGFIEGYEDASAQLSASGLLGKDVLSAIEETYQQVSAGVDALAERFGVESPVADLASPVQAEPVNTPPVAEVSQPIEGPVSALKRSVFVEAFSESSSDLQLLKSLRQVAEAAPTYNRSASVAVGESRDVSFELQTADGDRVTIQASALRVGVTEANFSGDGSALAVAGQQSSRFQFEVEGELDEGELAALNDLLGQVNTISELFFSGNVAGAFERALTVSFDESEISGFSYNARMASVERIEERSTYDVPTEPVLQNFIEQVDYAAQLTENLGKPRSFVVDLLDVLNRQLHQNEPQVGLVAPITERFL